MKKYFVKNEYYNNLKNKITSENENQITDKEIAKEIADVRGIKN